MTLMKGGRILMYIDDAESYRVDLDDSTVRTNFIVCKKILQDELDYLMGL